MKLPKNSVLSFCRLFVTAAAIFVFSAPAFAYSEDTHFILTYIICRSVGFTRADALVIAAVDQGMDDSSKTVANTHLIIPHSREEWLWHALDRGGKMHAAGIAERRDELFQAALRETDRYKKLIRLGVFFHYQQDMWAHRSHGKSDHLDPGYTTLKTPLGHALFGFAPDGPPLDPVAALLCLEDGVVFARTFLKDLGETPNPFLAEYKPQGGQIDSGWKDPKKGKFFNEIDLSGAGTDPARNFLLDLIFAQINVYGKSISIFPHYFLRRTAGSLRLECERAELQKVLTKYKDHILADPKDADLTIPTTEDKKALKFKLLTTANLLKPALPNEIPFIAPVKEGAR